MNQSEKRAHFARLHQPGDPLVLFNIWDPGSARAVAKGGAEALATGSASVAGALGYEDGQDLPLDLALENARRIAASVDVPLTLDFEGGYAVEPSDLAANAARVVDTGAVGVNFEDKVIGGDDLYDTAQQCRRIAAVRSGAAGALWINARTDIFLKSKPDTHNPAMVEGALARADAYARAGGDSLFVPGVRDLDLIRSICDRAPMPVNILLYPNSMTRADLAQCGVARISHGPFPWVAAMAALTVSSREALA
ncbi:isocitrate lyase/PEP mutase family protein [Pontivivens nitratireducens]|uniref:isocitrate lyase/PEP mutase family protein n=1 Tax=Pontivivens nitratireducens TaxID=2758038 RepID=UPI001639954B|nr:isocitrate lyase/phosphoenolpyruvate mutase family protein [Pontibrevibacter nitratireducens]